MTAQYTLKNGTIVMSDKDDKEFNQTFYAENDKKLDSLTEDFEKNTDGTPEYVQNLIGQADYDIDDNENSYEEESAEGKDVYSQQSEEKTESFKSEEITKTAAKIREDFLKSMIGAWVGGDYDIQGVDSSLMINADKTFTATYTSVSGDSNINYTGKFDFSESNTLEDKITELLEKETISSLNEIDTYSKYSLIVGKYDNSIDLKFAVSFTGTDFGKDVSKSDIIKIVGLSLDDGKLDFNNVLYDTIKGISVKYYIK